MPSLWKALEDAQACPGGPDEDAVQARKEAWAEVINASEMTDADFTDELAAALKVDRVTVRRWISGSNTPRTVMFDEIKKFFRARSSGTASDFEPEKPARFGSSHVAIWTVKKWFDSLKYADATFVCKGMMEFRGAYETEVKLLLNETLLANRGLTLYYVVSTDSPANDTFDDLIKSFDETCLERVRKITLGQKEDVIGLAHTYASPFVVKYRKTELHRRETDLREINIYYEIPVDVISETKGVPTGPGAIAYIQLPYDRIKRVWAKWAPTLANHKYSVASALSVELQLSDKDEKDRIFGDAFWREDQKKDQSQHGENR